MKLGLFAMWSPSGELLNYRKVYLQELRRCADYIIVIAAGGLKEEEKRYLYDQQIDCITRDNLGLDFGSWYEGLKAIGDLGQFSQVILANDSCVPIREFKTLAKWADENPFDYFGITTSRIISPHVQSYFVGFKPSTYRTVVDYFNQHKVMNAGKDAIIRTYEIGLSAQIRKKGFSIGALHPYDMSPITINPSIVAVPVLMKTGCPLIKRQIMPVFAKYAQPYCDFDIPFILDRVCRTDMPGFDEEWYLTAHPGVANMIKLNRFSCGFEHYLRLSARSKARARINKEREPLKLKFA